MDYKKYVFHSRLHPRRIKSFVSRLNITMNFDVVRRSTLLSIDKVPSTYLSESFPILQIGHFWSWISTWTLIITYVGTIAIEFSRQHIDIEVAQSL